MSIRAVDTKTQGFAGFRKWNLSPELCLWQVHKYFELQSRTRGAIRWLLLEINFLKKCDLTFHSGKLPQDEFSFWWTSVSKRGSKHGQKHKIPAVDTYMLLLYHLSFPCILIGLQMIFIFIYHIPRLWDDCPPNLELKLLVIVAAPQIAPICDWRASQLIRATSDLQRERGGDDTWPGAGIRLCLPSASSESLLIVSRSSTTPIRRDQRSLGWVKARIVGWRGGEAIAPFWPHTIKCLTW